MKFQNIGTSVLNSSRLIYGCMRIVGDGSNEGRNIGREAIRSALKAGYNHFDHADIYGHGECEKIFAEALKDIAIERDKIIISSKCGIKRKNTPNDGDPGRYDFSKDYIIESVEGSLSRLDTDFLDILMLHRPDYLFNPDEVAEAFEHLKTQGKVQHFGVSNFSVSQIDLLQSSWTDALQVNQIEVNIHNIDALSDGALDQCQIRRISPMAWCPLGGVVYPAWGNSFSSIDEDRIKAEFELQAKKYDVASWIIMFSWLLKHPAKIFPIVGSTNPSRINQVKEALNIEYSREDWYRLLEARNGSPVP
jgi:predicted oxidoreductase